MGCESRMSPMRGNWQRPAACFHDARTPLPSQPRVILIMAVGIRHARLVSDTCSKAVLAGIELGLVHYDDSRAFYETKRWYQEHVAFTAEWRGLRRYQISSRLAFEKAEWLAARFTHIWVPDEDVSFPDVPSIRLFVQMAQRLDLLIAQPPVRGSTFGKLAVHRPTDCDQEQCCAARLTNFVEVMAPLLKTCAFVVAWTSLLGPEAVSEWGVNEVWCPFVAHEFRRPLCGSCGVIDPPGGFVKTTAATVTGQQHNSSYDWGAASMDAQCARAWFGHGWFGVGAGGRCTHGVHDLACAARKRDRVEPQNLPGLSGSLQ